VSIPANFLSYYRRLFRQFLHDLFRPGELQAIGAGLGVAILVLQIYFGLIQPYVTPFGLMVTAQFTRAAIISLVGPYIGLILCLIIAVMATAAVDLDNRLGSQLRDALDARERSEKNLEAAVRENEELKKHRRTRSEQIIYDQAKNELANWGEDQLMFIRALIQREAIEHNELYRTLTGRGMSEEEWNSTVTWFRQNAGLVENSHATPFKPRDYWHINPLYREAVLELLHEAQ
jgi:ABC-type multidrug transport system fused ATPase/permease subunit